MNSHLSSGRSGSPVNEAGSAGGNFFGKFPGRLWQKAALFSIAFFLCAEASRFLSVPNKPFAIFWLPAGLYVAVLLLNETRAWPWLILAALPANLAFDLTVGTNPVVIFGFFAANTVQAVTGAWLIRRFVAERPTLATLKELLGLVGFSAVFSSVLGATLGAASLVVAGFSHSFIESWNNWWGALAMGILALSPFILTWLSGPDAYHQRLFQQRKLWEAALLMVVSITLTWHLLVFDKGIMSPNKSALFLPLLWAGLRFGLRGATVVGLFLLALPITFFTTQFSMGLAPDQIASGEYVFVMQVSLVVASLAGLIPAIVLRERDQKTDDLRDSEERFRTLTDAAFEGICISENGRIMDVNDQLLKMFGYVRGEMIGREILEFVAPESRDQVAEAIFVGTKSIYEHLLLRKNGGSFYAEAQAKTIREGNRTLRMTGLRDITDRKRAEEAVRKSEERMRLFFERQLVGMAITSPEKGWLQVNDRLCKMLGYSREELDRLTWGDLTYPEDLAPDVARFNRLLAGEINDYTLEKRFIRKDGRLVHTNLAIACVRRPDGAVDYVLALLEDITERKRAEAALRDSASLLRATLESTADGLLVVDLQGRIVDFNQQFVELWRFPAELVSEGRSRDLVTSEIDQPAMQYVLGQLNDPEQFIAKVKELYTQPEAASFDVLEFRDGRIIERFSLPQRKAGKPVGRVWSFRDVTERKRAEAALRWSESNLLSILEATGDGILAVDKEGKKVLKANRRFAEMWRIPQSLVDAGDNRAMIDFVLEQLSEPAVFLKNESLYDSTVTTADTLDFKDGRVFERHAFPMLTDGVVVGRLWSFRDITERKRAQEELRRSEEKYRKIFENVQDVFYQTDINGTIIEVSPSIERYSGYCRAELIGKPVEEVYYNPKDRAGLLHTLREKGEVMDYEIRLKTKTGRLVYASANAHVLFDAEEKPAGIEGSLRDISERKQAEAELRKHRDHLEELVKERTADLQAARDAAETAFQKLREVEKLRDDLVHMVVHDMRSPLMGLSMSLECLSPEEINAPDFQETLRMMREASHSLSSMVTSLLDVSRLESGQMPLHCKASDLEQLTHAALKRLTGLTHGNQISVRASNPPVLAHCDPAITERIFQNLLANALKFTPMEGSVRIELVAEGPWACFSITDTGPGIPTEYHKKVFEKFGQMEMHKTRKMPSSGLGLAFCKLAVEAQGGNIRLESEPDHGSTFHVRLPKHAPGAS